MNNEREILHLDMDAFYASVEVLDDTSLRGKPVIVGGGMKRGVVAAASYEARKFGVHSSIPMAKARRLCAHGVFLPVRMERYKEVSDRVFGIFRRYTPLVEPVSLDEAFLDITASVRLFGPPEEIARKIRAEVRAETGLTVSAGVASSKFVAKIASDMNKPDGLTVVPRGKEQEFLGPLRVGRLWGVGEATRSALAEIGVQTIGDLAGVPEEAVVRKLGKHGAHLHRLAHGIDDREVEPEREIKSMGREETFDEDLLEILALRRELLDIATRTAARLRNHRLKGRTVTLKVKYSDFRLITREVTLPLGIDDGGEIFRQALTLLEKTEAGKKPVRLLGIYLSNFGGEPGRDAGSGQIPLFGHRPQAGGPSPRSRGLRDPARTAKLNEAVDRIRGKYGEKGVRPGTLAGEEKE
ncbi:MAG: DNA polymerase IV [Candidatus Deferrimicrobiaceae bacterium]